MLLTIMTPAGWLVTAAVVVFAASMPWLFKLGIVIHHAAHKAVSWRQRVQAHYRRLSATPWMFTWCKTRMDPMFDELPVFFQQYHPSPPSRVLDVGCGYGITGCAMLEWFEQSRVYGLDPCKVRAIAARRAFGSRGDAVRSGAPEINIASWPGSYDTILALDMIHFLSDEELDLTLERLVKMLKAEGRLYLRAIITVDGRESWRWRFDTARRKWLGIPTYYRSVEKIKDHLNRAGLGLLHHGPSGTDTELDWFISGKKSDTPPEPRQ